MKFREPMNSARFEEIDFSVIEKRRTKAENVDEFFISERKDTATPEEMAKEIVAAHSLDAESEAMPEKPREKEVPPVTSVSYISVEEDGNIAVSYETEDDGTDILSEEALAEEISRIALASESEGFLGQIDALLQNSNVEVLFEEDDVIEQKVVADEETKEPQEDMESGFDSEVVVASESKSEANKEAENEPTVEEESAETPEAVIEAVNDQTAASETVAQEELSRTEAKKAAKLQKAAKRKAEKDAKRAADKQVTEERKQAAALELQTMLNESEEAALGRLKKRRLVRTVLNGVTLVSGAVFFICILEISWYYLKSYQYQQDMNEIIDIMDGGIIGDGLTQDDFIVDNGDVLVFPDEGEYEIIGSTNKFDKEVGDAWLSKYQALSELNPDCIGYISIPDTPLDLPVMFTPDNEEKYLYKNFSGERETRGTPFMAEATKLGQSQNYIIYGHNMKDGLVFGSLDEYLSKSYYKEHKYIYFNTAISEGIYEIMAVCKTKIFNVNDTCFKYYKYGGKLSKSQFETYVREVKKMALYNTGVNASWGDELITLSTCNNYVENGRLIVVAKRIK